MIKRVKGLTPLMAQPVAWVFIIAASLRLFACLTTHIINPDGIHYIHQARSVFYHDWGSLTTCHIKYISMVPFLIAPAYAVFHDWIAAGRFVSFSFSFATLFPLYFLLKRFFEKPLISIILLVYALIPVFVSRSADILRDPIFWFFICSGMLMFVRQWDPSSNRRYPIALLASTLFFLVSMWARIEGVMFIAASGFYLLIYKTDHKLKKLLFFSIPLICIGLAVIAGSFFVDANGADFLRLDQIGHELAQFITHYKDVRSQLKSLAPNHLGYFKEFLNRVREVVWYVPFALIIKTILKGFHYPYALLFVSGFIGISRRWSHTKPIGYFVCLSVFSLAVIYLHLLQTWVIQNRFIAILIFPSCLFIGYGIDNTIRFLKEKCRLKPAIAVGSVILFILAFGLGKNLKPHHEDKIIFRQIGEIIASQKEPEQVVRISGAHSTVYEWVFFYAHQHYPGTLCAKALIGEIPQRYDQLIKDMAHTGIRYLFYEENEWPKDAFNLMAAPYEKEFHILGKWRHKDTGTLMLLELRDS